MFEFNKFVPKGWGYEKWIVNGELYCGKILHFVKNKSASFHYHCKKTETFHILKGKVKIIISKVNNNIEELKEHYNTGTIPVIILEEGDSLHLEPLMAHQIIALQDSDIIEFSTQHFEDDSYRIVKGD